MSSAHAQRPPRASAYGLGRVTPQRRVIAGAVAEMPGAFTIDMLWSAVRELDAAVGLATVYRAVNAMVASGSLERVGEREGSALFVSCDAPEHHHHVVCDRCGRVEPTACPVVLAPQSAEGQLGFLVTRHEITLYGLCPECASVASGADAAEARE